MEVIIGLVKTLMEIIGVCGIFAMILACIVNIFKEALYVKYRQVLNKYCGDNFNIGKAVRKAVKNSLVHLLITMVQLFAYWIMFTQVHEGINEGGMVMALCGVLIASGALTISLIRVSVAMDKYSELYDKANFDTVGKVGKHWI